jgi:putative endonuclease
VGRENRTVGSIGEEIAIAFLKRRGYKILETNLHTPFGELDVVARQNGFTVFVEVKTRSSYSLGPPFLSVTGQKQRKLIQNALCYLKRHCLVYSNWRIDIVSINIDRSGKVEKIELIENAVEDR